MKKIRYCTWKGRRLSSFLKLLRIMRMTILILLCTSLNLLAIGSYSQSENLSLKLNSSSLEKVLKEIEESTGYYFMYNNEMIDVQRLVTVDVQNKQLSDVLELLFKGTNISYQIIDKQIVLKAADDNTGKGTAYQTPDKDMIRGKVLDSDGLSLPGASIVIKGTTQGTITDADGYYNISAKKGQVLIFSFIGYKPQEREVGDKKSIDIVLEEDITTLEEAVVVGMGVQRKASVIGSISSVNVTDLQVPASSLTNALSGRMSGAVIVQRSGEPGNNDASFWIRGISTFGSNQDPLILIDGVERSINDISVEEIESVSILKDASATAVYGTRAANGVVVVTTRRGKASDQPSIELKIESGLSDLPNMPEFLDGPEYLELYNEAYGSEVFSASDIEKTRNGTDPYLYPNVNWFNETFKKYSSNSQATLNISGGGEAARYFVSVGYLNEMGNFKDDPSTDWDSNINLKRYNFRSNVDLTLTKSTIVNLEIAGYMTDLNTPASNSILLAEGKDFSPAEAVFHNAYLATPISTPVKVPIGMDGNGEPIMGWGAPSQIGERNPAEQLMGTGYYTSFNSQVMSQLAVNQDLSSLVKGLSVKGSFSFDAKNLTEHKRSKRSDTYAINGRDSEGELIVSRIDDGDEFLGYTKMLESNRAEELKLQFNYDRTFDEKHRVGSMLMYYQRDYIVGDAKTAVLSIPYRTQGVAYRVTYSYKDRYFGEFNAGYNGSENFPKGHRFGFFPAFAGGWLVSGEPFWSSLQDKISMLKIRGSIGLVGAEDLPDGARFGYFSQYGSGLGGYYFGPNATYYAGTGENTIGVNNLTWEKGLKKDIGFELKMFKDDMISLEADFFHEKRYDILVQRSTIPYFVGINSAPYANIGEMVNRGVDGTLQFNKSYHNGGISLYGNFTYTRDKIKEMDEAELQYPYRQRTGQKYQQNFGLVALGYFESEEDITNSPVQTFGDYRPGDVKYKDINGDGRITVDDQVPIGYSQVPELIYGFGVQVDYKGFDLKLFFRGQARVSYILGGSYIPFSQGVGKGNLFKEALDRWTVDNPRQDALYPRLYNGTSSNNWQLSTKRLYNGSLLRLADVEVGKTFGKNFTERIGFGSLRVYAHVNNAALFSKWKLWDPETGSANGNHYPLQRKMNLGIRVTF